MYDMSSFCPSAACYCSNISIILVSKNKESWFNRKCRHKPRNDRQNPTSSTATASLPKIDPLSTAASSPTVNLSEIQTPRLSPTNHSHSMSKNGTHTTSPIKKLNLHRPIPKPFNSNATSHPLPASLPTPSARTNSIGARGS